MTGTEDRLTDALHAAARSATTATVRPLEDRAPPGPRRAEPRLRRRWLAAVASAAAVLLIAGVAVAVSARQRPAARTGAGAPPAYYVGNSLLALKHIVVRATATGRVTGVVPQLRDKDEVFEAVAAAGDRTFFVQYDKFHDRSITITIYRFGITAAGRVTGLARVPGGNLAAGYGKVVMAASPDGSRLAISILPGGGRALVEGPPKVIIINTRTGARTTWQGGPAPRGQDPRSMRITQLSWTANGRELVYLAQWTCKQPSPSTRKHCTDAGPLGVYQEVRTLNPTARGGSLSSGRLLVRAPDGFLAAATISPDGSALTEVIVISLVDVTNGPQYRLLRVAQVDPRTGQVLRMLHEMRTGPKDIVSSFVPGPSGQYLIVVNGSPHGAGVNGWIGRGRLHRLEPAGNQVSFEAW